MRSATAIFFLLLFIVIPSNAQDYRPDRPQFALSGYVLPQKTFSLEMGSAIEVVDEDQIGFNHVDLNVRISMMRLMEMSFGFKVAGRLGIQDETARSSEGKSYTGGFASPSAGVKLTMKEKEEDTRMAMAFYGEASINFGSKEFKDTKILPAFSIAMDIDWNERTNMRVNYGIVWLENRLVIDPEGNPVIDPFILAAIDVNGRINDKLSVFGEFFAQVKHNNFRSGYYLSSGLIIHLKDNVQLDISGGAGLSPESSRGFAQVGFSGLWPKKNLPLN